MLGVDGLTLFSVVRFLKHKSDVTTAVEYIIATHAVLSDVKIGIIRRKTATREIRMQCSVGLSVGVLSEESRG